MLIGPLIQVAREGDEVLLKTSHHWDAKDVRVEIAHVRDRRIPLVERVAFPDKQLGSSLIRCGSVHRWTTPLQQLDIRAEY